MIPWFSKTEGNTYATLLRHPFLFKGKPTHAQEVGRRISGAVVGESTHKSRHTKYPSQTLIPRITLFSICLSFSSPPLHLCRFIRSLFPSVSFRLPLLCLCVGLIVCHDGSNNTKLCDFSNTNNNDYISTPIAPITDAESCEINAALLNLVMKDQFSGLPSEDAATHLNNFVDLCDMQKKKDTHNDIVKLKLFPFSLRNRAKTWFRLCLKIVLIHGINAKMLLSLSISSR